MYNSYQKGKLLNSILRVHREHYKYLHPTQKPIAIMELIILLVTSEKELVVDTFMGGGSTGIACLKTNRNFVGIEIDAEYFEIAKKRIEDYQIQGTLFDEIENVTECHGLEMKED